MKRRFIRFMIEVLRPAALALGFLLRGLYWVLIGWWYSGRFRAEQQNKLMKEVEDQFWFLFAERHARLVPNGDIGHLALLNCPIVTLAVGNLFLRFIRWRDNSQVHVAPARLPGEWHELASVLNAIEPDKVRRHSIVFFQDAARLLKECLDLLEQGFSEDRYPRLTEQLAEAYKDDQAVTRRLENNINRRLYG